MQVFFGSYIPLQIALKSCTVLSHQQGFFFACQKDAAGAVLKKGGSTLEVAAPQHWVLQATQLVQKIYKMIIP